MAWAFSLSFVRHAWQSFHSGICGGEPSKKQPQALLCQSQLDPASHGSDDRNIWHVRTAARQNWLHYSSSSRANMAPTYLPEACSHWCGEDAPGDRWVEIHDRGDSWSCAAEGALVKTWPKALFNVKSPC